MLSEGEQEENLQALKRKYSSFDAMENSAKVNAIKDSTLNPYLFTKHTDGVNAMLYRWTQEAPKFANKSPAEKEALASNWYDQMAPLYAAAGVAAPAKKMWMENAWGQALRYTPEDSYRGSFSQILHSGLEQFMTEVGEGAETLRNIIGIPLRSFEEHLGFDIPTHEYGWHNSTINAPNMVSTERGEHKPFKAGVMQYQDLAQKIANETGANPDIIMALMSQEAPIDKQGVADPTGVGPMTRSGERAVGLMQVMPSTARFMKGDPSRLKEPEYNVRLGTQYFMYLLNANKGDVQKAIRQYYGRGKPLPGTGPEGSEYVRQVAEYLPGVGAAAAAATPPTVSYETAKKPEGLIASALDYGAQEPIMHSLGTLSRDITNYFSFWHSVTPDRNGWEAAGSFVVDQAMWLPLYAYGAEALRAGALEAGLMDYITPAGTSIRTTVKAGQSMAEAVKAAKGGTYVIPNLTRYLSAAPQGRLVSQLLTNGLTAATEGLIYNTLTLPIEDKGDAWKHAAQWAAYSVPFTLGGEILARAKAGRAARAAAAGTGTTPAPGTAQRTSRWWNRFRGAARGGQQPPPATGAPPTGGTPPSGPTGGGGGVSPVAPSTPPAPTAPVVPPETPPVGETPAPQQVSPQAPSPPDSPEPKIEAEYIPATEAQPLHEHLPADTPEGQAAREAAAHSELGALGQRLANFDEHMESLRPLIAGVARASGRQGLNDMISEALQWLKGKEFSGPSDEEWHRVIADKIKEDPDRFKGVFATLAMIERILEEKMGGRSLTQLNEEAARGEVSGKGLLSTLLRIQIDRAIREGGASVPRLSDAEAEALGNEYLQSEEGKKAVQAWATSFGLNPNPTPEAIKSAEDMIKSSFISHQIQGNIRAVDSRVNQGVENTTANAPQIPIVTPKPGEGYEIRGVTPTLKRTSRYTYDDQGNTLGYNLGYKMDWTVAKEEAEKNIKKKWNVERWNKPGRLKNFWEDYANQFSLESQDDFDTFVDDLKESFNPLKGSGIFFETGMRENLERDNTNFLAFMYNFKDDLPKPVGDKLEEYLIDSPKMREILNANRVTDAQLAYYGQQIANTVEMFSRSKWYEEYGERNFFRSHAPEIGEHTKHVEPLLKDMQKRENDAAYDYFPGKTKSMTDARAAYQNAMWFLHNAENENFYHSDYKLYKTGQAKLGVALKGMRELAEHAREGKADAASINKIIAEHKRLLTRIKGKGAIPGPDDILDPDNWNRIDPDEGEPF